MCDMFPFLYTGYCTLCCYASYSFPLTVVLLIVWQDTLKYALWKINLAVLQMVKWRTAIGPSNSTPRYKLERIRNRDSSTYLYINVHSIIQISKRNYVKVQQQMNGSQTVEYHSALKTWSTDTRCSADEPWKHCAKEKQAQKATYGMVSFIWNIQKR